MVTSGLKRKSGPETTLVGKPYFVSYENTTPDEPCSGYYFSVDEKIVGPFSSFERAVQATMEMEYE